jgi:hypothetical protein
LVAILLLWDALDSGSTGSNEVAFIFGTRRGRRDIEYGNSVKEQSVSLLWLFSRSYFGGEADFGDARPLFFNRQF